MKLIVLFSVFLASVAVIDRAVGDELSPEELTFFESNIRPVLIKELSLIHI